jgi:cytochrome c biogenesis protein ResB
MSYRRNVKDYVSALEIVKDDQVVAAKEIEVNRPLYYGGYHFYQSEWGEDQHGEYTVLQVVSDSGLNIVYAGYILLIGGIFWHFWGRRALDRLKTRRIPVTQTPEGSQ